MFDELERPGGVVQRAEQFTDLRLSALLDVASSRIHMAASSDGKNHIFGRLWTEPIGPGSLWPTHAARLRAPRMN